MRRIASWLSARKLELGSCIALLTNIIPTEGLENITLRGHIESRSGGTKDGVIYLMSLCEWRAERRQRGIIKKQTLLRFTRNRQIEGHDPQSYTFAIYLKEEQNPVVIFLTAFVTGWLEKKKVSYILLVLLENKTLMWCHIFWRWNLKRLNSLIRFPGIRQREINKENRKMEKRRKNRRPG